ncbi:MAG: IS1 family transposase [Polyangiaceae bacterium]
MRTSRQKGKVRVSLLSLAKRAEVIAHLCEGAGIRPTSRLASVSQPTILSLLLKVGRGCDRLHDRLVRDLSIRDIQCDEIWSYVQKKQARVEPGDDPTWGDAYTWLAIARSQKVIVSYRVGKRDEANAQAFMRDLRARLVTVPQLCSDGFASYATAVGAHFEAVDFAQVVKNYSRSPRRVRDGVPSDHRYEPPRDPFCVRTPVYGAPDMTKCSTSHVERLNLDVRMSTRRLTRLCNGFSRKLTHHTAAISLFVAHHNFCKIHSALRVTPAMEAGITDHVWSTEELVERALAHAGEEPTPPEKKALRLPETASNNPPALVRALPNGRGFLRLVMSNDAPGTPSPEPSRPAVVLKAWEQLELFHEET